jgi:hypothetical protein
MAPFTIMPTYHYETFSFLSFWPYAVLVTGLNFRGKNASASRKEYDPIELKDNTDTQPNFVPHASE